MRIPSTRMIWCCGSTRAPNRRTVSPSTSTRPSPISSSQCRRLPTPAAASTFCSRTPPGTSIRLSRSSSTSKSSGSWPRPALAGEGGRAGGVSRRADDSRGVLGGRPPGPAPSGPLVLINRILNVFDVLGQEGGEVREFLQAGQAEPLQEIPGRPVENSPRLALGAGLFHQSAERQRAQHTVAVDAADRRHPRPVDRLPVRHHGQRLQGGLGQPHLLPVPDEPLDYRRALGPGVEAPATRYLAQVEATLLGVVGRGQIAQGRRDLAAGAFQDLRDDDLGHRLVHDQQDRLQAGPQPGAARPVDEVGVTLHRVRPLPSGTGLADVALRPAVQGGRVAVSVDRFAVPGAGRVAGVSGRAYLVLHAHPYSSSASAATTVSGGDPVCSSGPGSATQVTYSSPSGATWSNETLPSRYSSSSARKRATTS